MKSCDLNWNGRDNKVQSREKDKRLKEMEYGDVCI